MSARQKEVSGRIPILSWEYTLGSHSVYRSTRRPWAFAVIGRSWRSKDAWKEPHASLRREPKRINHGAATVHEPWSPRWTCNSLESQWLIIMGYFEPIMVYFGVWWPVISSSLAVQVSMISRSSLQSLSGLLETFKTSQDQTDKILYKNEHLMHGCRRKTLRNFSVKDRTPEPKLLVLCLLYSPLHLDRPHARSLHKEPRRLTKQRTTHLAVSINWGSFLWVSF